MKRIIICFLFNLMLLNACRANTGNMNHNLVTQNISPTNQPTISPIVINNDKIPQEDLIDSNSENDLINTSKGSISNPYLGSLESFQFGCEIPEKPKSKIHMTFTHAMMEEIEADEGWFFNGRVQLEFNYSLKLPININDYISIVYYDENGVIGDSKYSLYYSNTDSKDLARKEFEFNTDRLDGWIINNVSKEDLEGREPAVAAIRYYNGEEYKEVFVSKYENGSPRQYINAMDVSTIIGRGSIENPYHGSIEFFDVICQIPGKGKKSEIKLEFSSTLLSDYEIGVGCSIMAYVELLDYNQDLPISINDYVSIVYYDEKGIVGAPEYSLYYSDTDYEAPYKEEFHFNTSCLAGWIYNSNSAEEYENRVPKIAALKYYDGEEYREIYFIKYANGSPEDFIPNK